MRGAGDEDGFALVAVLGFLMLLAVFLTPFAGAARLNMLLTNNEIQTVRANDAAMAVNRFLIWRLSTDRLWRLNADRGDLDLVSCRSGMSQIIVSIIPHAGLINLNTAEPELLSKTLANLGVASNVSSGLVENIIEFRSPRGEVSGGNVMSGFKHGPFEHLSELYDFPEMRSVEMAALVRHFSLWSGRSFKLASDSIPTSSQHYTIETSIGSATARGNAAVIYTLGEGGAGQRLSILSYEKNSQPAKRVTTCGQLLGSQLAQIVEEAIP